MKRIEVKNLNKSYENFSINNLSFALEEGFITGFIGPNGSGKTTTIKAILNFIKTESGKIFYKEKEIKTFNYLKEFGVVMDSSYLAKDWKINQVSRVMSIGYENWDNNKFKSLLSKYKIKENLRVKELSRGMSTKLMIAIALSHNAKTLILDEPTSGLDPSAREEFRDIIQEYMDEDERHTVLFSTHITTDLEAIADYILFILNGKIIFNGTKDNLLESFRIIKAEGEFFKKIENDKFIGRRDYATRSEALIKTENLNSITENFIIEKPSIDNILIFFNRGEI